MARVVPLGDADKKLTGLFAGALLIALRDTEGRPDERAKVLTERLAQYFERLGPQALPLMIYASWVDFTTTVIECLPEAERKAVWKALNESEGLMRELKQFVEPALKHMQYGYEKWKNGGIPPLKAV